MRVLGFPKPISLESFRTPNWELMEECLRWLAARVEPDAELGGGRHSMEQRVALVTHAFALFHSRANIKLNGKRVYGADGYAVREMMKVASLCYARLWSLLPLMNNSTRIRPSAMTLAAGYHSLMCLALLSESGIVATDFVSVMSHECEWESKSPADTWSFRLLHGRLRLTTRLAHRHYNASRTRVLGDTPVLDIAVEAERHDRKNPVATLCVRFACETMRYIVTHTLRNPCYAKDIPPLLRRCAAVARVALRWGRAMHDAKLHLAYTLDNDGNLSLKVANVRLRSVWEVTMRIELVVEDSLSAPWPRAGGVSVTKVLAELDVPDSDVRRLLASTPRDWGHAPRTIWQMFRYLKNKTRDDELLAC